MSELTEDEAKTKWCPMVRNTWAKYTGTDNRWATMAGQAAFNRVQIEYTGPEKLVGGCIGSACMMWRQGQKRNPNWKPRAVSSSLIAAEERHPDDIEPPHVPDEKTGFCGLAGGQP